MRLRSWLWAGLLCAAWVLAACQPAPSWSWERAEAGLPRQAVILALAVDPGDPDRLWAGYYAPGGLAMSHDAGRTWQAAAQGLRDNPVFDLLSSSGDMVWAATRDGLMRSTDRGRSWSPLGTPGPPSVSSFALASDALGQVYVGLDDAGLYRGTPQGDAWEALSSDERLGGAAVLSLAVSADGQILYVGTAGRGLYASQDAGRAWIGAFGDEYVANLAISPHDPMLAVASLRDRLVRTRDGGASWETLPVHWASDEVVSLLWTNESPAQSAGAGTLLAGSGQGQVYCSQDGGRSWEERGPRVLTQGGVLALALAGDRLLAGTWTGIYASPVGPTPGAGAGANRCGDPHLTWKYLSPSLGMPHAHVLLQASDGLLIGTRAGLFRWEPAARRWEPVTLGDSPAGTPALASSPSPGQAAYAGTVGGQLYRSDDGGATWARVPAELEIGSRALAISPEDDDQLYMLAAWERVYESRDGGLSWQGHWTGLGVTTEAISLAIDPAQPSTIYLGSDSGLYRSRYGGGDWQPVGHRLDDQTVLSLVARPDPDAEDEASTLYIGATRGAYRSLDGGDTVEPWGIGLEGVSVTAILFDPDHPRTVYAGTAYAGLYRSGDGGETWQAIGPPELTREAVETMAWGPEGELFVASAGGVWLGLQVNP